jgi:hypothetical protein
MQPRDRGQVVTQDEAESVGIQALAWIAADPELAGIFLSATGADVNDLRKMAGDPAFLGGVLEFLLQVDSHVTGFCDSAGLPYDAPMRARVTLSGGEDMNWT